MAAAKKRRDKSQSQGIVQPGARSPLSILRTPLILTISLMLVSLLPRVQSNPILQYSFWGAVLVLLIWQLVLYLDLRRDPQERSLTLVLRPQHYIQMMVQIALYAYWGYYWQPVYDHFWLIIAQLLFAYSFDILLAWSRRRDYTLGFGPFPIILSINLFIWWGT